ncbi:MAG TPA: hypothetical protein VFW88_06830 [Burkholderiales bacterium]|nr:hypothetical protein [Burkholderiales bacterium]
MALDLFSDEAVNAQRALRVRAWESICEREPELAELLKELKAAGLDPTLLPETVQHFAQLPKVPA